MRVMSVLLLATAVLAQLTALAALVTVLRRRRHTAALRAAFGRPAARPHDRPVPRHRAGHGAAPAARDAGFDLRPIPWATRERLAGAWAGMQTRFLDAPALALCEADQIVTIAMRERGYPTDGAPRPADSLSLASRRVLDSFRAGRAIEEANRQDDCDVEQVRQGMLHFRTAFDELVQEVGVAPHAADRLRPVDQRQRT